MTKEERITAERERLTALLKDLDENQQQTAAGLVSSAAFLRVSLEDLETIINKDGYLDEYENGANQSGVKTSAAVQTYTALNTKYQSIIQKLLKIVPPAPKKPKAKPAAQIEVEKAEAEAKERRDQVFRKQQRRDTEFMDAVKNGTATNETYKEFCAEWEREHADD